ncbi:GNAT family N-acetyltransferase [Kineosporia sp. J2-2]|uniref:GNAT family N-acetyltransferase n=1 Tax=Kineosporia corallincola TaxID=2835133 RepID=A0ABS5TF32_9ACTN|nr:GNAT family N-acetyltransferase [Kineosporia corallincola]MBT0769698.1 GNAT family N-acetyltransferase [Kineosporia corallincola]
MEHEIRVLTDAQEVGRSLEVFLTAMVGLQRPDSDQQHEFMEPGRTVGAYVAPERLVGTASSFTSWMMVPGGKKVPQAAVTDVGVLPTHTRRGLAGALVRHQLEQCLGRGEVLASLRASEATIYERWGFGIASNVAQVEISVPRAQFRDGVPRGGDVRLVDLRERADQDLLAKIYLGANWVGAIDRPSYWWRAKAHMRELSKDHHYAVVHGIPGHEDGFAVYTPEDATAWFRSRDRGIVVGDFVTTTTRAHFGLLRYLLSIDLLQRVILDPMPVDHSIEKLFTDERAVTSHGARDETWLRLVDVEAALGARTYRAPGQVILEVRDDLLRQNTGRYLVSAQGVARTEQPPDITLDVGQLACAYLGGTEFWQLAQAGRIAVHKDAQLAVADHLFGLRRAPFGGTMF